MFFSRTFEKNFLKKSTNFSKSSDNIYNSPFTTVGYYEEAIF